MNVSLSFIAIADSVPMCQVVVLHPVPLPDPEGRLLSFQTERLDKVAYIRYLERVIVIFNDPTVERPWKRLPEFVSWRDVVSGLE